MTEEKIPCEKHKKFNYYCKDCQAINRELDSRKHEEPPRNGRYRYIPHGVRNNLKKYIWYVIVIIVTITLLSIFWIFPSWTADINLQIQLYFNKADANFRDIYFLNLWSGNFFFNKTALIFAIIGCIIMSIPPSKSILTILGSHLSIGKPSRVKALIIWWTIGFVLFFLIGQAIAVDGKFPWVMYLLENGMIEVSASIMGDAFNVLTNINNIDFMTIFIYSSLILPIISFIFGVLIFRSFLNIVNYYYVHRNDYYILSNLLLIIGWSFGIGFFSLPTLSLSGLQLIQMWAVPLGFISFPILSLIIFLFGRKIIKKGGVNSRSLNRSLITTELKKVIVMGLVVLILILTPIIVSVGTWMNLSNTAVWTENQWDKLYEREVDWSRTCAGLDMFEERPIEEFYKSSKTSDLGMISHIRQYDQSYAVQFLAAKIGSTYEGLADSDIVYINNKEYWIAPKTIRFLEISGDDVQTSTELYDHVEGFLAMDTYSGELIDINSEFNIDKNYPIFFGEHESERFLIHQYGYSDTRLEGAFDSDVLLGTEWSKGIDNNLFIYEGTPDGTLTGIESYWKDINLGLMAYALQEGEHPYLINRNVKTRVESILLPQLRIDNDPYLVIDIVNGKLFYAVSIYTYIHIGSYSKFPILRFLGVCLVDVKDGDMTFYENPALKKNSDPTYPIWKIYSSKYSWKTTPSWLKEQIRYPEDLFELQLEANYLYHVQDSTTWKREDDFHKRPEDGDLYYIETDLGDGIEYVGVDLVEYIGQEAKTLAGMYVIRHGDHLGEAIFYHTRDSTENLIGPKTARDTYESEATQEISLIADYRHGNTLLYPIAGSLYYYIPTYSTAGDLQQLKLSGFVEAFTRKVGYGEEALDAYNDLDIEVTDPPGEFTLSSNAEFPESDGIFNLTWTASGYADSYSIYSYDSAITEINNSLTLEAKDISVLTHEISEFNNGTYYYIVEATNEYGNCTSNYDNVTVAIPHTMSYQFDMEENMIIPDDLARFRIELENYNTNFSATGLNVKVNLSLYIDSSLPVNFSIVGPSDYSPIENYTYDHVGGYSGINFTLINGTFNPGVGEILSGFVNCTSADIIIHFKWYLIIDDKVVYISDEKIITVLKKY